MIATIKKGESFGKLIMYNEDKISEGIGTLLDNQTFGKNAAEYEKVFNETVELNKKVYQNKSVHICLSLPPGEAITNETFTELARDYLTEMKYDNNPYLVYKHSDKDHSHIHIITTSVTWDGKKVSEFGDHKRSKTISRDLELKYKLAQTIEKRKGNYKLSEKNADAYRLHSGIIKAKNDPEIRKYLVSKIGEGQLNNLIENPIQNHELKTLFVDAKDFTQLNFLLENKGLLYKTNKSVLEEKLQYYKSISKDKHDFFNKLEKNEIYVIELNDKGKDYIKYGFTVNDQKIYYRDKFLKSDFRYDSVQYIGKDKKLYRTEQEQRVYLRKMVKKAVTLSVSLEDFTARLSINNIEVITHGKETTRGISGISFISKNLENPIEFKGSKLEKSLSWQNIKNNLDLNSNKASKTNIKIEKEEKKQQIIKDEKPHIPNLNKLARDMEGSEKDEFEREQERKRKNGDIEM